MEKQNQSHLVMINCRLRKKAVTNWKNLRSVFVEMFFLLYFSLFQAAFGKIVVDRPSVGVEIYTEVFLRKVQNSHFITTVFYDLTDGYGRFLNIWMKVAGGSEKHPNAFIVLSENFELVPTIDVVNRIDGVLVTDVDVLYEFLQSYEAVVLRFNRHRKFVFYIHKLLNKAIQYERIKPVMQLIWKNKIWNYSLIFYDKIFYDITYNPFTDQLTNNTGAFKSVQIAKFGNLHGHELRVSMLDDSPRTFYRNGLYEGNSILALQELGKRMNATIRIVHADSFERAYEDVRKGVTDFCFIGQFHGIHKDVAYSDPFKTEDVVVVVPKAGEIPAYLKILNVYEFAVWMLLLTTYLLYVSIIFSLEKRDLFSIFYDLFGILLGLGLNVNFKSYKPTTNFFLGAWLFFAMIMSFIYSSAMASALFSKQYFKEIDSLAELKHSNLTVVVLDEYANLVPEEFKTQILAVSRSGFREEIKKSRPNFAYSMMKSYADSYVRHYGIQNFHIVGESLIPGLQSYIFEKSSPYIYKINDLLKALEESGLSFYLEKGGGGLKEYYSEEILFTLDQTYTSLGMLVAGFVFSIAVFLAEIFIHSRRKKYVKLNFILDRKYQQAI